MLLGISLLLVGSGLGLIAYAAKLALAQREPVLELELPRRPPPRAIRLSPPPPRAESVRGPTPTPLLPVPEHERVTEPGVPAVPAPAEDGLGFFTKPTVTMDLDTLARLRAEAPTRPVRLTTPARRR